MPGKYIYQGGTLNRTLSVARAILAHFDRNRVYQTSPDGQRVGTFPITQPIRVASGNRTLLPVENGATVFVESAAGGNFTLPKASLGKMRFRVALAVDVTSNSVGVVPATTDTIRGNRLAKTAGTSVGLAAAGDAAGDFIELESDGVSSWLITAIKGTWA
jgi:hypothetical protein